MKTRPKKRSRIEILQLWSGTLMIAVSIFVFATLPEKQTSGVDLAKSSDLWAFLFWKAGHVLGFALFAGFFTLSMNATRNEAVPDAKTLIAAGIAAVVIAIATELLQEISPGRNPSIADVGFDLIGAGIGLKFAIFWRKHATA